MALVATTVVGAITADQVVIVVASSTGFTRGNTAKVDSEEMTLQAQNPANSAQWTVTRGVNGTRAVAHTTGTPIATGAAEDWANPTPPAVYTYGADQTIPALEGVHELNTGAATVFDLATPGLDQDGLVMKITARTAHAYNVVAAEAFLGSPGANEDEAVFGGAVGDNFVIMAQGGRWLVLSVSAVTFAT